MKFIFVRNWDINQNDFGSNNFYNVQVPGFKMKKLKRSIDDEILMVSIAGTICRKWQFPDATMRIYPNQW